MVGRSFVKENRAGSGSAICLKTGGFVSYVPWGELFAGDHSKRGKREFEKKVDKPIAE